MKETWRTFDEWSRAGYKIVKGSKATWFEDVAKFSNKQVVRSVKPVYGNHWKGCTPKGTSSHWNDEEYEDNHLYYGSLQYWPMG